MDAVGSTIDRLQQHYADAHTYRMDGVSVEYPSWHFNVRPSNTEPLIRLNLEGETQAIMEGRRDGGSSVDSGLVIATLRRCADRGMFFVPWTRSGEPLNPATDIVENHVGGRHQDQGDKRGKEDSERQRDRHRE